MAKGNCIFITLLTFPFEFLKSPLYLLFIYYLFSLRLTEFVSCMCDFARFFFLLCLLNLRWASTFCLFYFGKLVVKLAFNDLTAPCGPSAKVCVRWVR